MKVISYTDLRLDLKKYLDQVVDGVQKIIVKRKDQKDVVLISLEEYNSLVETNYLLTGKNREVLLNSIKNVEQGNVESHELIDA